MSVSLRDILPLIGLACAPFCHKICHLHCLYRYPEEFSVSHSLFLGILIKQKGFVKLYFF